MSNKPLAFPKVSVEIIVLIFILIANAFFLNFNAFRGFNFFDLGSFLDPSWRVFRGQKPYVDFLYLTGPVHLYMNAFFFMIFGFGKTAVLAHLVVSHSIAIILTFFMARKFIPFYASILVTLLTTACFYWTISHPWYDQSAHLWGLLGLSYFIYQFPFKTKEDGYKTGLICGALIIVSFMTKTNVGTAHGALLFMTFLMHRYKIQTLTGYAVGAVAALLIMLVLIGSPARYIEQAFFTFDIPVQKLRRFIPFLWLPTWFSDYYWIAIAIVLLNIKSGWKNYQPFVTIFLGLFTAAVFCASTGSMKATANIPLWGIFMTFGFIIIYLRKRSEPDKFAQIQCHASLIVLSLLTCLLIYTGAKRGLALDAWSYGQLNPFGDYRMKTKQLRGWLAPKDIGEAVDQAVEYINKNIPKNESMLVLTDLQVLYALTGRDSFRGITFDFAVNEIPPPGKQLEEVRNNILTNPPVWIVTHRNQNVIDFVRAIIPYLRLEEFVQTNYVPVQTWNNYVLLRRR